MARRAAVAALTATLILGAQASDLPDPDVASLMGEVDEARLRGHVEHLAGATGEPRIRSRHILHPDIQLAEQYLVMSLEAAGYTVTRKPYVYPDRPEVLLANIIAERRGKVRPDEVHVLGAHYDSTASAEAGWDAATDDAPGADDNATGCAVLLEIARLLAGADLDATVRFVFFTAEEEGLLGSADYATEAAAKAEDLRSVVILDPAGNTNDLGDNIFFTYDAASSGLADRMTDIGERYRARYDVVTVPGDTAAAPDDRSDHKNFWDRGYPALHGAALPGPGYHTSQDTADTVDMPFVAETTRMVLAFIAESAVYRAPPEPEPPPPECACASLGLSR